MRFQPKTEKEAAEGSLLKVGECDFEVKHAEDKTSSSGNDMIELSLVVYDVNGKSAPVRDFLVEAMAAKLRHFCYATGLGDHYEQGTLRADLCVGVSGRLKIDHEIDKTKKYPPKNVVADYVAVEPSRQIRPTHGLSPTPNGAPRTPTADAAMNAAKRAFAASLPGSPVEGIKAEFVSACRDYIPGKPSELWTPQEWERFVADKFIRQQSNPIGQESVFAADDIPF